MRVTKEQGDFKVKAIAGTHTILIALDCEEERRRGLLGFGFKRGVVGSKNGEPKWLRSLKVFKSVEPDPLAKDEDGKPKRFDTGTHPVQSFLWGDYGAEPGTKYQFSITPMYGKPGALEPAEPLEFEIRTEKANDAGHGVWFNRGAIASQAFSREFGNKGPEPADNPDPNNKITKWLSRGLLEACLDYINSTPKGDGLRVAAYEFTYAPVVEALKKAMERGVDVRIIYHDTTTGTGKKKADGPNEAAINKAGLKAKIGNKKILFPRTKTKIPHNKFIVRLKGGTKPIMVWTGSTNFTPSGFLGQTNVGHSITDDTTAKQYMDYWTVLKDDPDLEVARLKATKLTGNPPALLPEKSIARVFSPRHKSDLLKWYGDRVQDAAGSVMFTAAFGVAKQLVPSLAEDCDYLRFILMEKPPTDEIKKQLSKNRDCIIAYGAVLGEMYTMKDGKPVARRPIKEFNLDKWFFKEEHFRKKNEGFVFFIHTKFLLIDPLSDDPLVCSGSANFSSNSLLQNDENMLLVRGDTRVADIYLTEFDRIFRHFYFRDVANEIEAAAKKGKEAQGAFLDETDKWTDSYFKPTAFKTRRRELFFGDTTKSWVTKAGARPVAATKKKATKKAAKKKTTKKATKKASKKTTKKKTTKKK